MWGTRDISRGILIFGCAFVWGIHSYALKNSTPIASPDSHSNVYIKMQSLENGSYELAQCNGVLISETFVLTDAHCLTGSTRSIDSIQLYFGAYREIKGNYGSQFVYKNDYDVIGAKNIFFPSSINKKVQLGQMNGEGAIRIADNIALIEMKRPVDLTKIQAKPIRIISQAEYKTIRSNPAQYSFVVVTTNYWEDISTSNKRYAYIANMTVDNFFRTFFGPFMWSTDNYHQVQAGDSGAPLFVNIAGQWKLIGLTKGLMRDGISQYVSNFAGKYTNENDFNITKPRNIFAPVVYNACNLARQTPSKELIQNLCE